MLPNIRTPLWMKILIIVMMLPVVAFPTLLAGAPADSPLRMLVWFYPPYVLVSGVCAWMCYATRPEITWILLNLLLLSHASIFYLAL